MWCRGRLRLVMVALRSRVTRSRRLVAARTPARRQLHLARSLRSRMGRLTRSLWWQRMLVVVRSLRWRPLPLRRPRCLVLRGRFWAGVVTLRLRCRGPLRLVMVALRSRVTRSRRLVAARTPARRQLHLARSLGSRTALLTRSLWWQLMLVVIRSLRWRQTRLRQVLGWLVTLAPAAARFFTSLVVQRLCLVRRVVRAVVIWRLRRLVGSRVVILIQAFSGVAETAPPGSAATGRSRVLPALLLVQVSRILPRLWLPAPVLIRQMLSRLLLRLLLQPTLRPSMVWSSRAGSCPHWVSSTRLIPPTAHLLTMVLVG